MILDGTLEQIGAQGKEDMQLLLESNKSAKELQELAQSGALDQLKEAQAGYRGAFEQLLESNRSNEEIQALINSGALEQIDAQNEGAFEQLVQAGTNEQELQKLINSGAIDQIQEKGLTDQELQKLVTTGAIEQINVQNVADIATLVQTGVNEQELQRSCKQWNDRAD